MIEDIERNLGEQPIVGLMAEHAIKPHDVVAASTDQITHKMITRACKGRRLSRHVQDKIVKALNTATEKKYLLRDLFNY